LSNIILNNVIKQTIKGKVMKSDIISNVSGIFFFFKPKSNIKCENVLLYNLGTIEALYLFKVDMTRTTF
jgi:hypothetical protein